jgi:hypothetical protein
VPKNSIGSSLTRIWKNGFGREVSFLLAETERSAFTGSDIEVSFLLALTEG